MPDGRVIIPRYCKPCSLGVDVRPTDYIPPRAPASKWPAEYDQFKQELHIALNERAVKLLWSGELKGEKLKAWGMFCAGVPDRKIALAMDRSREFLDALLAPLKTRCGYKHSRRG